MQLTAVVRGAVEGFAVGESEILVPFQKNAERTSGGGWRGTT